MNIALEGIIFAVVQSIVKTLLNKRREKDN